MKVRGGEMAGGRGEVREGECEGGGVQEGEGERELEGGGGRREGATKDARGCCSGDPAGEFAS